MKIFRINIPEKKNMHIYICPIALLFVIFIFLHTALLIQQIFICECFEFLKPPIACPYNVVSPIIIYIVKKLFLSDDEYVATFVALGKTIGSGKLNNLVNIFKLKPDVQ